MNPTKFPPFTDIRDPPHFCQDLYPDLASGLPYPVQLPSISDQFILVLLQDLIKVAVGLLVIVQKFARRNGKKLLIGVCGDRSRRGISSGPCAFSLKGSLMELGGERKA